MPERSNSKPLSDKRKDDGLTPHQAIQLDSLAGVRCEMARLYRLATRDKLDPEKMTKFIYALREIRSCLEAETLSDVQARLAALTASVGVRRG